MTDLAPASLRVLSLIGPLILTVYVLLGI